MVAEWIACGYRLPVAPDEITVLEVADAYLEHAKTYYFDPRKNAPSSALMEIRVALDAVTTLYGDIAAVKFGPNALRAVRQVWIDRGITITITTINGYAAAVRRMFKWAAAHEMVPVETFTALGTLSDFSVSSLNFSWSG